MRVVRHIPLNRLPGNGNLMQSSLWGTVKRRAGLRPLALELDCAPPLLILLRRHGAGRSQAYVPWGPLPRTRDRSGRGLERLSRSLEPFLPAGCVSIRYDLPWSSPWQDEPRGRPPTATRELEINFGTEEHRLRKAPTDVQPADTLLADLDLSDDQLLARMHRKTRYNIRLAARRGVRVRAAGPGELDRWYLLYRETMKRHGTTVYAISHFRELLEAARTDDNASVRPGQPARHHAIRLLFAEHGRRPLAGMVLTVSGDYAIYLFGASGTQGRNLMPAYLLQWEAMRVARSLGARHYDFFGVPSDRKPGHPMHGLLRFKEGFGGRRVIRRGCWDFPLDLSAYRAMSGREAAERGYHGAS